MNINKYLALPVLVIIICLTSWGYTGHQTVARVAENHLTPQAKEAIKQLLGNQSIADIASWADEVRNKSEYRSTAPWHFVNVPIGLNAKEFANAVEHATNENLLTALKKNQTDLTTSKTTLEQKTIALKFIVHLVGDAHQPMHISRAEDKGGNTIQVQFDGRGTNLHSLWDSRLIDKQGLSDAEFVSKFDQPKPAEIAKWQSSTPVEWMFESYQISSMLYKEIETNNKLGDAYYQTHIGIINNRLEQGGIRLAGLLNSIFKNGLKPSEVSENIAASAPPAVGPGGQLIELSAISMHIGEVVIVRGKVFGYKALGNMTLVNVGGEYPNQLLTIVLRGDAKNLASAIDNQLIEVTGKLIDYKGKPEIEVQDASNIFIGLRKSGSGRKGG